MPDAVAPPSSSPSRSRTAAVLVAVALPPLALAAAGLSHPSSLTDDTAVHWRDLHIALLPVFPLLAIAPILLTRRHDRRLGILAVVLGFVYAVCYQALDILAGIAAGALKLEGGQGVTTMYALADGIVVAGVWSYVAVTVLASALVIRHAGLRALPGAVIAVVAAVSFVDSHIFFPRGVITMLGLAIGWTWLALASRGPARRPSGASAGPASAPAADRAEAAA
ncbi:hypothetical protein QKG38_06065 [Clavibacter michiganensis]|uniref:hypothetical protein n=1 Tax=Clavibacter michiganensis TaxID=28447 RepID=UPI000B36E091|nr:hypothetical protein [Clavibacter michiganensis]MDO4017989.1 hypothetical protein [Clavibacter michiganensis]MDO4031392.1 hypothetical protein [Clavibacter michiganensis]MDO4037680.1 hypothetical protein [Clavibacter michiganensis]MDO4041028.1 hypothetical protein [Clavibacter michiganensis]MDO4050782.1 hypothetical protein [Clavibacter michiganensis]